MAIEVTLFREQLRAWLKDDITGMSAQVSGRVYSVWPMEPPTFPLITFSMSRVPEGDYPLHAWRLSVFVRIYSENEDTLDTIEDLILTYVASNGMNSVLSGGKLLCEDFALVDVSEDMPTASQEDSSYAVLMRQLTFNATITEVA